MFIDTSGDAVLWPGDEGEPAGGATGFLTSEAGRTPPVLAEAGRGALVCLVRLNLRRVVESIELLDDVDEDARDDEDDIGGV